MNMLRVTSSVLSAIIFIGISACSGGGGEPATTTPGPAASLVADAGRDQSVFAGTFVTLNGSKSTNANQSGLIYAWTLAKPASSNASLSNPNIVNPTMTVDVEGTYTATLVVMDAQNPGLKSAPDTVLLVASKSNPPPAANAGDDRSVFVGRVVTLNGNGSSDANNNSLRFNWTFTRVEEGSGAILSDRTTVAPSFTPDKPGAYIVQLVVNDGTSDSTPDSVTITASDKPAPTANAGVDRFAALNTANVTLNGSGSKTDPPTSPPHLTYEWTIISSTLAGVTSGKVNESKETLSVAIPPNTAGTIDVQLKVTDLDNSDPTKNFAFDKTLVTVGPRAIVKVLNGATELFTCPNLSNPCTATVKTGTELQLDATASAVTPLEKYEWFLGMAATPFTSGDKVSFTPNPANTYSIGLKVTGTGGENLTDTRSFTIVAKDSVSSDFTWTPLKPAAGPNTTVTLSPIADDDPALSYKWEFVTVPDPSTPPGFSPNDTTRNPTFTADKPGDYKVKLTVTDVTIGTSEPIEKPVPAHAKPSASIQVLPADPPYVCGTVQLSAPENTFATYKWTITPPGGGIIDLGNLFTAATFKAVKQENYSVSLVVTDALTSVSESVTKDFTPQPNPGGSTIFNQNGLTGMEMKTFQGGTGPKCTACHAPGTNLANRDLRTTAVDIRTKVTTTHTGGTINTNNFTLVQSEQLNTEIANLRQYLDSTRTNGCPP